MTSFLDFMGHKVTFQELPDSRKWQVMTDIALRSGAPKNHWCCAFGDSPAEALNALSQCIEWKASAIHALTRDEAHHDMLWSLKNQLFLFNEIKLNQFLNHQVQS